MSKIVILGAGISGHVAAAHLRRKLSKKHEVLVVSPNSNYQWIPSNIWVGIGRMKSEKMLFPLAPLNMLLEKTRENKKKLRTITSLMQLALN